MVKECWDKNWKALKNSLHICFRRFSFFHITRCIYLNTWFEFDFNVQYHFDKVLSKVQVFWEGHKILCNLPDGFDVTFSTYITLKHCIEDDCTKFCGLLKIYYFYKLLDLKKISWIREFKVQRIQQPVPKL